MDPEERSCDGGLANQEGKNVLLLKGEKGLIHHCKKGNKNLEIGRPIA